MFSLSCNDVDENTDSQMLQMLECLTKCFKKWHVAILVKFRKELFVTWTAEWIWKCGGKLEREGTVGKEMPKTEAKKRDFAKVWPKLRGLQPPPPPPPPPDSAVHVWTFLDINARDTGQIVLDSTRNKKNCRKLIWNLLIPSTSIGL